MAMLMFVIYMMVECWCSGLLVLLHGWPSHGIKNVPYSSCHAINQHESHKEWLWDLFLGRVQSLHESY